LIVNFGIANSQNLIDAVEVAPQLRHFLYFPEEGGLTEEGVLIFNEVLVAHHFPFGFEEL
jgi:hypothetical protein